MNTLRYIKFLMEDTSKKEFINEMFLTKHFNDRLNDRVKNIKEVKLPKELEILIKNDNKDLKLYKSFIISKMKEIVEQKIQIFKTLEEFDVASVYVYIVAKIRVKYKKSNFDVIFVSDDNSKLEGNIWYVPVFNDVAYTLILNNIDNEVDIKKKSKSHILKNKDENNDAYNILLNDTNNDKIIVKRIDGYVQTIDLDVIDMTPEKMLQSGVKRIPKPLKTRVQYGKGETYVHNRYGKGVIQTAKLNRTEEDGTKVYHVIVDFPNFGLKKLELKSTKVK